MPLTASILSRQLEELSLLKHSLLPGEALIPASPSDHPDGWQALLESWQDDGDTTVTDLERAAHALPPAHFRVEASGVDVWFELRLGEEYMGPQGGLSRYTVSVKGATLGRGDQAAWQAFVKEKMEEVHQDSEYPVFELVSAHLLPRLHAVIDPPSALPLTDDQSSPSSQSTCPESRPTETDTSKRYHALFTSHHLVSPTKRRSLQQWSAALSLTGFAKVGHPGVIYCEGARAQVKEFVADVKAMQWLALRLRFIEPLPDELLSVQGKYEQRRRWVEFEKVGEVVDEMRRLGKGQYVVDMGIGSAGTNTGLTR